MYAEHAHKLTLTAKRTQTLPTLPPYSTELVRQILQEVRHLDVETQARLQPFQGTFDPSQNPQVACALLVNHLAMRRNKRCLLAYHRVRMERIEQDVWKGIDVGASQPALRNPHEAPQPPSHSAALGGGGGGGAESSSSNLSPEEEEYGRQFTDLLAAYKGRWTDVDLTGSLEPPRELFIDVRVLKDAGEIQTEYGAINLTKNSQFYVRQADVERLIAQGYLQKLG